MKLLLMILVFISLKSFAVEEVKIIAQGNSLTQGQIADVMMGIENTSGLIADIEEMKGKKIEDTIYILDIKDGIQEKDLLTYKAKIIFIKSPTQNSVRTTINGKEVQFSWDNISVIAAGETKGFLWGEYQLDSKDHLLIVILVFIFLATILVFYLMRRRKNHALKISELKNIKITIDSVKNYEDIISLWNNRDRLLACFPLIEADFRELEKDLFKYIFKPSQSPAEREDAYNSFKKFRNKFKEGAHGV
jgi:hypothetical protein